jgi:hypothetical protein
MVAMSDPRPLFTLYRVAAPVGYVDGLAAACALALWLLLGWAVQLQCEVVGARRMGTGAGMPGARPAVASAVALGLAVAAGCLLDMAQSRGADVAVVISCVAALVLARARVLLIINLGLSGVAVALVHPWLGRPFTALGNLIRSTWVAADPQRARLTSVAIRSIHHAGEAALVAVAAAAVSAVLVTVGASWWGALRARRERVSARGGVRVRARARLVIGAGTWLLVAGAATACAVAAPVLDGRTPAAWVTAQVNGCVSGGGELQSALNSGSHLGDVGTNRCDFWRVALDDARRHPVLGIGAGNFGPTYRRYGHSSERPAQAHSLELQILGELGVVGAVLALVAVTAMVVAVSGLLARGTGRAPMTACVLAGLFGWLAHACVDWLWQIPLVTVPAALLAGGIARISPNKE